MSAREALIRSVYQAHRMSQNDMERLVDAYAHELAEEIRQETERLKADGVLEADKFRPCRDAANQIDPESPRCTCGETACESELCDCDQYGCPAHDPEVSSDER